MLTVEFTGESRTCYRCGKKWTDGAVDQAAWTKVKSATTKELVEVCSTCFDHYSTKSREYRGFVFSLISYKLNAYFGQLTGTSRTPSSSAATSSHTERAVPIRKLVANSWRGTGMYFFRHNW